jgi:hypothetical protein
MGRDPTKAPRARAGCKRPTAAGCVFPRECADAFADGRLGYKEHGDNVLSSSLYLLNPPYPTRILHSDPSVIMVQLKSDNPSFVLHGIDNVKYEDVRDMSSP